MLSEELTNLDTALKEMFVDRKYDEMRDLLKDKSDTPVKDLMNYNWSIVKKYYDNENFTLLFQHYKYVAYSCFLVEYSHQRQLISDGAFNIMLSVYNDIYEYNKKQRQNTQEL